LSDDGIPTVRRHAAVIVACVVALVVGLLVLRGLGGLIAERKQNQVLRAWAETLGSFEDLLASRGDREATETALSAEELAAGLGIDLVPTRVEGRLRPTDDAQRTYRRVRLPIGDYLERRLQSTDPAVPAPPDEVAAFLADHAAQLIELERLLSAGEPPLWQRRLEEPFATPLPNLRGHVDLQRLLLVDALTRADAGDTPGALDSLEASWQLNAGLRDEPDLAAQGGAVGIARMQLGALRHVERLPALWLDRIREHDFRRSYLSAFRYEGWIWMRLHEPGYHVKPGSQSPGLVHRIAGPYLVYSSADLIERWRLLLIRLDGAVALCDADPAAAGIDPEMHVPGWNLVGKLMLSDLSDTMRRLARYDLDLELTVRVLEIRARARSGNAQWPETLPGGERSTACPDERWVYRASPGREMSLALSRTPDWGDLSGLELPTSYAAIGD